MMTAKDFALNLTVDCGVCAGDHVLAAVSGGADSVALLCLLCEVRADLKLTVSCAHMEHGIRGEASIADMEFVRKLCAAKGVAYLSEHADVPAYARENGLGLEDAARALRYAFLDRAAKQLGADYIALAHHAQDQAETVLMHAARGSDIRGLCAMRFRRGNVIRPLLRHMPQALRMYLESTGQPWREDETNQQQIYARNRIRAEVVPAIQLSYPGAVQALCRLAAAAQRDESHFESLLDESPLTKKNLVDGVALLREELISLDEALRPRAIARELERCGFGVQEGRVIEEIAGAVLSRGISVVNLTCGAHAYVGERYVSLIHAHRDLPEITLSISGETVTPYGVFSVREAEPGETGDGISSQALDETVLCGSAVTGRRMGDTLIPFGRHTAVKLKKLMIDAGVERPIRNSLPVIRKGENILWAVGLRPSELCRAQGGRRMMITYISNQSYHA